MKYVCKICDFKSNKLKKEYIGKAKGNTKSFLNKEYTLWKCPSCGTIHTMGKIDYAKLYSSYELYKRKIDYFAQIILRKVCHRLKKAGLKKNDSILNYGCGNGLLVNLLKNKGYKKTRGFDPYIKEYANIKVLKDKYDFVILNDRIEHTGDPKKLFSDCVSLLKKNGKFYVGMPTSEGVNMGKLEKEITRLHLPYHRVLFNQKQLILLGLRENLRVFKMWKRSYIDTPYPFVNYRFLNEILRSLGWDMDKLVKHQLGAVFFKKPILIFYGFFGYFFPLAYEPAILFEKIN